MGVIYGPGKNPNGGMAPPHGKNIQRDLRQAANKGPNAVNVPSWERI